MEEKQRNQKNWVVIGSIFAVALLLIFIIANIEALNGWTTGLMRLLRPTLIGLVLAYLFNPIFRLFERRIFSRLRPPAFRRAISLICTYLTVLLAISAIVLLIVPQLIESILTFARNYESNLAAVVERVNGLLMAINRLIERFTGSVSFFDPLKENAIQENLGKLLNFEALSDKIGALSQQLSNIASGVADVIFAIFISIYLLTSKEKRYAQVMKCRRALFSTKTNAVITRICTVADRTFGSFAEGKFVDCLIVGVILWVSFAIFHIPYAPLLAAFIAIANFIPMVGPFIGAIPSIITLLLTEPEKAIPFLVIVVLVQQIDSNIITPKIVGNNTGVSALCVLIAIVCTGAIWGVVGLLLSVPLFATILTLVDEFTVARLQRKGIPSGLENYYAADIIVDPAKYSHATMDNLSRRFERAAIRVRAREEQDEQITRKDRMIWKTYQFLQKHRFFGDATEDDLARISAEQAAKAIERDAMQDFSKIEKQTQEIDEISETVEESSALQEESTSDTAKAADGAGLEEHSAQPSESALQD